MMFRVIGGVVVYGFALYGVAKALDRPKVALATKSDPGEKPTETSASAPAGAAGEQSGIQADGDPANGQVGT